jgi:hypothetical protein
MKEATFRKHAQKRGSLLVRVLVPSLGQGQDQEIVDQYQGAGLLSSLSLGVAREKEVEKGKTVETPPEGVGVKISPSIPRKPRIVEIIETVETVEIIETVEIVEIIEIVETAEILGTM